VAPAARQDAVMALSLSRQRPWMRAIAAGRRASVRPRSDSGPRAGAGTAHVPIGEGAGTVLEAYDAAVGESAPEDRRGEGGEGGVAVVRGLALDVPGARPALRIALLQHTGSAPGFFEERTGDGRERWDRAKEVGAGGAPGRVVLGEATARDARVDRGVGLQWSAPGGQAPGATREGGPDEALVLGEPCEGCSRGLAQSVIREALRRADQGA
jgi:hypothetical protein